MRALALACLLVLLSGCMDTNAVTVSGQGYTQGGRSKTLDCDDGKGTLALGAQGAGQFSVTVKDASGAHIFHDSSVGAGQDGQAETLQGAEGTWTLTVNMGLGYGGQYSVTLTC